MLSLYLSAKTVKWAEKKHSIRKLPKIEKTSFPALLGFCLISAKWKIRLCTFTSLGCGCRHYLALLKLGKKPERCIKMSEYVHYRIRTHYCVLGESLQNHRLPGAIANWDHFEQHTIYTGSSRFFSDPNLTWHRQLRCFLQQNRMTTRRYGSLVLATKVLRSVVNKRRNGIILRRPSKWITEEFS